MKFEALLSRIKERLEATGLSERKACMNAGVGINTIRHIRVRGHAPKPESLAKLAGALGVPPAYFLDVAVQAEVGPLPQQLVRIHVRGAVQAGAWREAIEWGADEWFAVTVPGDERFPDAPVYGLQVRGTSMDLLYPDGTIILAVPFFDIGRPPQPGERVVVLRRSNSAEYEATLKQYEVDKQGRHVLWPRSTDPEFQQPIILGTSEPPVALAGDGLPTATSAGAFDHHAGGGDLIIAALVIGSYRRE